MGLVTVEEPATLARSDAVVSGACCFDGRHKGWSVKNRATNEFLATTPEVGDNTALPRLEPVPDEYTAANGSAAKQPVLLETERERGAGPPTDWEAPLNVHQWDDSGQSKSAYIEVAGDGTVQPHIGAEDAAELASVWTLRWYPEHILSKMRKPLYMRQVNDTVDLQLKDENNKARCGKSTTEALQGTPIV